MQVFIVATTGFYSMLLSADFGISALISPRVLDKILNPSLFMLNF